MTPVVITNPKVYTVPDIDSDSEPEDYYRPPNRAKHYRSEEQEKNLIRLGCYYNPLEEYKRTYILQNPKCFDQQYDIKLQQHQLKVEKEREMFLEKLRKKKEEDKKKYDSIMSELSNLTLDEKKLDKEFQEELAKQRKSVEEAIAYDRKIRETETAEARSKAEKEQKELEQEELKKKENEKLKKMKESNATSLSGLEEFKKYYAKIEHYKVAFKPKMDDAAFSKAWFIKKKGIKRTISQLTSNHEFIFTKYKEIYALLMNIKQESNDAFEVTLNYLSKEILRQVEVDVSNKPYCAYIFARFTYMICSSIPEFTDYLLGRLYKRCPYIVPQFHDDDPTLSKKEMQKRLRYTYSDKQEKVGETFLLHAERNKGFIMFYVALCSTIPDPGHPQNPFSIKSVWIYLARLLNMSLRPISPFLVGGVLNIAGKGLLDNYPNQAPKLFRLLQDTVLPLMLAERTNDSNSAIISVGNFLSTYFEKGVAEIISETPPESQNIVKKNFY
ncbi:GLE1-like protein-domain-containing protein [Thamnidium elegans]|nr:GLE1-like protein-domain-containing protein [Thamnidium elegans]